MIDHTYGDADIALADNTPTIIFKCKMNKTENETINNSGKMNTSVEDTVNTCFLLHGPDLSSFILIMNRNVIKPSDI